VVYKILKQHVIWWRFWCVLWRLCIDPVPILMAPYCNFGQLVNILQGFFQEDLLLYFGVRRALFATATATATATAMLMRQGLRGLAPFKPGRISSEAE
jgi:hypothetical protein